MNTQRVQLPNVSAIDKNIAFDRRFPLIEDLRVRAKQRMPRFAYEYVAGGCNREQSVQRNEDAWCKVLLVPHYTDDYQDCNLTQRVFGQTYSAPFGIAPVGLQGLIWPGSTEILARAAVHHNVPFVLSTVTTASIETIGEITNGKFWFQLYHPAADEIRDDILERARKAGCEVLVVTIDVPTFGYRPKEYRRGLAMPPKITLSNILQMMSKPRWSLESLQQGVPRFATMKKYMDGAMNLKQLGRYMKDNFDGRITRSKLAYLRDTWPGKLVVKGVASRVDMDLCIELGMDGVVLSNHGGRQLEAAESTLATLQRFGPPYNRNIVMMIDGGLRSGVDVGRALAHGAKMAFMGRPFMYGVGALGRQGGNHTISVLKLQLIQLMQQLGCSNLDGLPEHLVGLTE